MEVHGDDDAGMTATGGTTVKALADAMAAWPDERLTELLDARPELTTPIPRDFAALATRAGSPACTQACRHRLDRFALQVADAMGLLEDPVTIEDLLALLGKPAGPAAVSAALGRLEALALVVATGTGWRAVPGIRDVPLPAGLGPPFGSVAGRTGPGDPVAMAKLLGVAPGRDRASATAAVTAAIADPSVLRTVIGRGPKGTVELVQRLVAHPVASVASSYHVPQSTPAGWLAAHGLLVPLAWNALVLPREVGLALRGGRPFEPEPVRPPLAAVPVDRAAVDAAAAETAFLLVADVAALVDACSGSPPKLLKSGGVGVRDLRRLAKLLARPEPEAARVVELAGVAGLIAADPLAGDVLPTADADGWLALDTAERWTWLARRWLDADLHLSLAGAMGEKQKPIPALLYRGGELHARRRRHVVLAALAGAGPGHRADRAAVRARASWDAPALWVGGPASPTMLVDWVLAEADLLGVSSAGVLGDAGRAAAAGEFDRARHLLGQRAPAVVTDFVIQADFSAMAPGRLAPEVLSELELLADVESTGAAMVFRFSEASLARALGAGRRPEEITAFLSAHATKGVPQPLAYLVGDLGRRYGRVRAGPARSYVRSDDPALLAEAIGARRTAPLALRLLAPTVAVSPREPTAVVATLREAGYLAAEEDTAGQLVLQRRERRRATVDHDWWRNSAVPTPEPATVVATLRRSSPTAPSPPSPAPPPLRLLEGGWGQVDGSFDDGPRRPVAIAHGPAAPALLVRACEEEWLVRVAHVNGRGQVVEWTVALAEVDEDVAFVQRLPRWTADAIRLDRVRWARVLTDAEEEVLIS